MRHGDPPATDGSIQILDPDDLELQRVFTNLDAWHEAHPCTCEAICECDDD